MTSKGMQVVFAGLLLLLLTILSLNLSSQAQAQAQVKENASVKKAKKPASLGIDISNHQGYPNWSKVGQTNIRFVYAKATEGRTFVDSYYAYNKAGAKAAKIKFGAYHFARPEGNTLRQALVDARKEANLFLRVAKPQKGNLKPVLDLESNAGLSPNRLKKWAAKWLRVVKNKVHEKPVIYTYPYFWQSSMADKKFFAKRGYQLWIANYGVSYPSVPADNWKSRGHSIWQYTDCRSVSGIGGCVDGNILNTSLQNLLID